MNKKLCILIPFKNREENLRIFIPYMTNFMLKNFPHIEYEIVIIEQCNDKPFNKGILFNSGFLLTKNNFDYYALHDIDELPISANYNYNDKPFHLCVNVFEQSNSGNLINFFKNGGFKHRGGTVIINKECYKKANGHSNLYWGWGCIDINFSCRLEWSDIKMYRYKNEKDNDNGYFLQLKVDTHRFEEDEHYKDNYIIDNKTLNGEIDWKQDGLNNVKYELIEKIKYQRYTRYKINF